MLERNLLWIGVISFTAMAALHDRRTGHIPNALAGLGLSLGAAGHLAASLGHLGPERWLSVGVVDVASGVVVCGAAPLLLFKLGLLGGGDVKLLAGVGSFLGPELGLELCFVAFVIAALYVPARLLYAGVLLQTLAGSARRGLRRWSSAARSVRSAAPEPLKMAFAPSVFLAAGFVAFTHWSRV